MQGNSLNSWFSDAHTVLSVLGILMMAAMSWVGYKVHAILFDMKLPERMARLEGKSEDHENRLDNLEKKTFGL